MWSEKRNSFSGLLKNKGFKEKRKTKVGLDAIDISTTLESNKSLIRNSAQGGCLSPCGPDGGHLQAHDAEQCCAQPFRGDKLFCPTEFCRSDMQGV